MEKCIEHKTRASSFSTTSARNTFRSDKHLASYARDERRNARVGLHAKCPVLVSDF
jgi:hypothetical protein